MIGYKACPLCEKADKVEMLSRTLFETCVEKYGSSMLTIKCTRCNVNVDDYNDENEPYDIVHDRLAAKWNSLPRWQKLCIKFE